MPVLQVRIGGLMLAVAAVAVACWAALYEPAFVGLALVSLGPAIGAARASRRSDADLEDAVSGAILGAVLQAGVCVFLAPIALSALVRPIGAASVIVTSTCAVGFILLTGLVLSFLVGQIVWSCRHASRLAARLRPGRSRSRRPGAGGPEDSNHTDEELGSAPRPPERVR